MGLTQKLGTIPLAIQTDSSNNVGIGGAANASYKLAVTGNTLGTGTAFDFFTSSGIGSSGVTGLLRVVTAGTSSAIAVGQANSSRYTSIQANEYITYNDDMSFRTFGSFPLTLGTNNTTRLTISASGNVGIGTSDPNIYIDGNIGLSILQPTDGRSVLSLVGTRTTADEVLGRISFTNTNTTNAAKRLVIIDGVRGADSNSGYLSFQTANSGSPTERMRIRNDGFLKVKGNAANYISPNNNSHEISTNQASNYNTFLVSQTASDPYGLYIWYSGASPNNNMNEFLACADSTNAKAYIFANGNLANRNGSYGTISSDIRLKENIANATSKLNDILKLNVVNFNFKDDIDKKKQIGFIAQEFQDVFPSLVSIRDTRKYDEEGNLISGLEDALGVNVGMEFAILVKAIQELSAKVTALENK